MTSRDRFLATLTGQPVDRPPFMKIFGGVNKIQPRWERELPGIGKNIDQLLQFEGLGRGWASTPVKLALCDVGPGKVLEDSSTRTVRRFNDGTVVATFKEGEQFVRHTLEYPVKTREDWQRIKAEFMDPADPRRFPANWKELVSAFQGRGYPLQLTHAGVYGFARRMMGDERLAYAFYDEPGLVHDMLTTYTDMALGIWARETAEVEYDLIECWEDMASNTGSMISPTMFRAFLKPQYQRIARFAREHGIKIILVDSDGFVEDLVELWVESGVTAAYPFEAQAGNDVERVRRRFPNFGVIGALNKNVMARDRAAIDAEMVKARRLLDLGRYIPGPDHFVLSDASWENYRYFMEQMRQVVVGVTAP
jgi:uroporphyrinogen decarboxylase